MIMKPTPTSSDWLLVPRSEAEIVDDWFVSGLCATGSKDIILDDVFIPEHRVVKEADALAGRAPGAFLPDAVPNTNLPFIEVVAFGIPAAVIGMTQGLVDIFQQSMRKKRSAFTNQPQIERVANQLKLAEAKAATDAATVIMRSRLQDLRRWGQEGLPQDPAEVLTVRRDAAYVSQSMVQVATKISIAAGANGSYLKNPIQRFVRDILVGGSHAIASWEEIAEPYGRAAWGLDPMPAG
jgi:3-hydroxy-9,10-secoandrosta-1,3,5(10)-triene-9,17-dione monooxygenase